MWRVERRLVQLAYPLLAALVRRNLGLTKRTIPEQRQLIDAFAVRIEALLADGRRYLLGERLTAADVALAALPAPAVLPLE